MPTSDLRGAAPGVWPPGGGEMARRIREHDWASTPLGATESWPQSLKVLVELMLAAPHLATLAVGAERRFLYNDEAARHYGDRHPDALGQPLAEVFAHEFAQVAPFYDRVFSGESLHVPAQPLDPARTGAQELFDAYLSPVRDGDGQVIAAYMSGFAIGERVAAEAALRESEGRFRALANASTTMVYRMSPDWRLMHQLSGRDFLADTVEPATNWAEGYLLPEDRPTIFAAIDEAIRTRTFFELEHRVRTVDGGIGWVHSRAVPMLDEKGNVVEWFGTASDITERRESEERLRQFGEASSDVLWIRDAETFQWEYLTPAFEAIYGLSREEALSGNNFRNWAELIVPEDRKGVLENIRRVAEGERATFEYRIKRPLDGGVRWLRNTDFPMRDASGRVAHIGGVGHDVTALKQAEERQKLLLAELQHRVRNTLGVIRSVVRRTARTNATLDDYTMHLDGRIEAFSRVQSSVTRDPARGVDLEYLVAEELRAVGAKEGDNLTIEGPKVLMSAKAAEVMGLAVHELATNAMKYGALTAPRGEIKVRWEAAAVDGVPTLDFHWTERGMRLDGKVSRRGFGTEILTRTLGYELKARTELAFPPTGLRCRIEVPLAQLTVQGEHA